MIFMGILLTVLLMVIIALSVVYISSSSIIRQDAFNFLSINLDNTENEFLRIYERMDDNLLRVSINGEVATGCLSSESEISYEGFSISRDVSSTLVSFMADESYLKRIAVVTEDGRSFSTENYVIPRDEARMMYGISCSAEPGRLFMIGEELALSRPVYSYSMDVVGRCIFILDTNVIETSFASFEIPGSVTFATFSDDMVLGQDPLQLFPSYSALMEFLGSNPDGTSDIAGEEYFVSHRDVAVAGITIYSFVPYRSLIMDSIRILWITIILIILTVVISVVISWLLSKLIVRDLRHFRISMLRIWQGNLSERVEPPRQEELKDLASIFNMMMDRVNELMQAREKKEREKERIRWDYLNEQIRPHFIYNTLNNIRYAAIERGEEDLADVVSAAVELLRAAIGKRDAFIALSEELVYAAGYVRLYDFRTSECVTLRTDIPPALLDLRIPILSLEPLIENAALHGYGMEHGGEILIRGWEDEEEMVHLSVHDEGVGFDVSSLDGIRLFGIGVRNVIERFSLIYGDGFRYSLESEEGKGTTVELIFRKND